MAVVQEITLLMPIIMDKGKLSMKEAEVGNTILMIKEIRYMSLKEINILPKSNLFKRLLFLYLQKNRRKMKLTKISLAALVALGAFSSVASATPLEEAIKNVLKDGYRTSDIYTDGYKKVGTIEMGNEIINRI